MLAVVIVLATLCRAAIWSSFRDNSWLLVTALAWAMLNDDNCDTVKLYKQNAMVEYFSDFHWYDSLLKFEIWIKCFHRNQTIKQTFVDILKVETKNSVTERIFYLR